MVAFNNNWVSNKWMTMLIVTTR